MTKMQYLDLHMWMAASGSASPGLDDHLVLELRDLVDDALRIAIHGSELDLDALRLLVQQARVAFAMGDVIVDGVHRMHRLVVVVAPAGELARSLICQKLRFQP